MYLIRRLFYYITSLFTFLRCVRNWPVLLRLGKQRGETIILTLSDGTHCAVRSLLDAWIVKETNLDRTYERHGSVIEDGWNIVDIGAGLGDFVLFAARRDPHGRIFAFEPAPESVELLKENLRLNRIQNVAVYPCAVSEKTGTLLLDISGGIPAQFRTHMGATAAAAEIEVQSIALADVLAGLPDGACDFLKMDCEGAEYDILLNLDDDALARIRRICLEYHEWAGPFSHMDLVHLFERKGWRVRISPSRVRRGLGILYAVAPSVP